MVTKSLQKKISGKKSVKKASSEVAADKTLTKTLGKSKKVSGGKGATIKRAVAGKTELASKMGKAKKKVLAKKTTAKKSTAKSSVVAEAKVAKVKVAKAKVAKVKVAKAKVAKVKVAKVKVAKAKVAKVKVAKVKVAKVKVAKVKVAEAKVTKAKVAKAKVTEAVKKSKKPSGSLVHNSKGQSSKDAVSIKSVSSKLLTKGVKATKMATKKTTIKEVKKTKEILDAAPMSVNKAETEFKMTFEIGQYIVYPRHGIGLIKGKNVVMYDGKNIDSLEIFFEQEGIRLLIPMSNISSSKMRSVSSQKEFEEAIESLRHKVKVKRLMWVRRSAEYESKISNGDVMSLASVIRELYHLPSRPAVSYSERLVYIKALRLFVNEYAILYGIEVKNATAKVEQILYNSNVRSDLRIEESVDESKESKKDEAGNGYIEYFLNNGNGIAL